MKIYKVAAGLFVLLALVLLLIYGRHLMIPFLFAMLLWFFVREIKFMMERIRFIKEKIPSWIKTLLSFSLIVTLGIFVGQMLTASITGLAESYETYRPNIDGLIHRIESRLGIDLWKEMKSHALELDFGVILGSIFNTVTDLLGNTLMILFYALFLFIEEASFPKKLQAIFTNPERYSETNNIIRQAEHSIARYMGLKTMVSLLTGLLSYGVLLLSGIDAPVFWAFLIFFLNFIPTIGSVVATFFPALFSIIQFGDLNTCLLILIFVGLIQVAVGNYIEPRLMGNSLNISPLVAILSLSFWGAIWGITGMILSVPLTVIMVIVFSHFPKTRAIAILLSEKGNV